MSVENEPGPAQGQQKIEDQVHNDIEKEYQQVLKREQEAMEAKMRGDTTARYEEVRKLGFATKQDLEENIKGFFGKFMEAQEKQAREFAQLREWVMRAKAQGLNAGATDDKPVVDDPLKKWRPSW